MVSIIVPVYNARRYLHRCVASILEQSLQDLQLILVDDGSADGSGTLCDEFAAKDSRVTVLHQKNAGVSAARNAGLAVAKGEFVGFVDADDAITPDAYEQAVNAIGAAPGDFVTVETASGPVLAGAAVLYMMPIGLFFAGYFAGAALWNMGTALGCMAFAAGIALAVAYDRLVVRKKKTVYTITGYAAGKPLET